MSPGHIYLIDTEAQRRDSLAATLKAQRYGVHSFEDIPAFLNWIDYERVPETACVLTHLELEPMSGVDLLDVFRADRVALPAVLIGTTAELHLAVKAVRYGGAYILWRPFTGKLLSEVISIMLREWSNATQKINVASAEERSEAIEQRFATLSRRQRQVLRYVFEGNCNRDIADALGISVKTVELHRACMMRKMHADSVIDLIKMASHFRDALEQCA